MKPSRRELLAGCAASLALPIAARPGAAQAGAAVALQNPIPADAPHRPNLTIRDYLTEQARHITAGALAGLPSSGRLEDAIRARRQRFHDLLGLTPLMTGRTRGEVPVTVTGGLERPGYHVEKLHYQSLPDLHVTANLYMPRDASASSRRPAILYVCGHAPKQKVHYQGHARRFAELGFPTLVVETVQLGEITGYHHGCYSEGWFNWYSRGYSPAAIEAFNGIRALDLLASRPEVDPSRMGVTGISGGGAVTWWIAAADERVAACAPVCGTLTLESHIYDRVIDGHCDCMWWINTALWDLADVGSLIAPRPLLIASANQDGIFPIDGIRRVHSQLETLYARWERPAHLRFVETPGGHSYHERSRTAIYAWFLQHLMGKTVDPSAVGDIELDRARLEPEEALTVYVGAPPRGNRAVTIQDEFIELAPAPRVATLAELEQIRTTLRERLLADTFNHFPRRPVPLQVKEEFALDGGVGSRFAFTSEDGWRLHGTRRNPERSSGTAPAVVVLSSPGEARHASADWIGRLDAPWVSLVVETRGTGDTAWGDALDWHVRRAAAWTGRTVASMRVWDALRALEAARALPGVDPAHVAIAARDEMAAVALYAALLDGRVQTVLLESPPATQDAPGRPDGRGPAIEMLNCLRYTDLPFVAGLLYPADVVIAGSMPSTYSWGRDLYGRLGGPARFTRVASISGWTPARTAPAGAGGAR